MKLPRPDSGPAIVGSVLAGLLIAIAASSCGTNAPYQARMDYLHTVAQRGADTHALLEAQGAAIDKKRCEAAFDGLADSDEPQMTDGGDYHMQVEQFFVDSCVSGKPKPVPGQSPPTGGTVSPS